MLYTSTVTPVFPLIVDTAFYTQWASLNNARLYGNWTTVNYNLALNRPTSQSSTCFGGSSSRAVDGNTDGVFGNNSVTHSCGTEPGWWSVDLGLDYTISTIDLFNRTDCCGTRLSNYDVYVINAAGQTVWSSYQGSAPSPSASLTVGGIRGRTVKVQLRAADYLSLAEVRVLGVP